MLKVTNICKRFGPLEVLKEASLDIGPEIRVLIGINGCGKSTLLKIIAGITDSDSGQVMLKDRNITDLAPEHRHIGYVPQHPALFGRKTVLENIRYGMRGRSLPEEILSEIINLLGIDKILDKKPGVLSGGYKSRVSLARALAPKPDLMLFDEPMSDIDAVVKEKLLPEFRRVTKLLQVPVLYVTHDPAEAEQIGDTFSAMVDGRVTNIESARQAFEVIKEDAFVAV